MAFRPIYVFLAAAAFSPSALSQAASNPVSALSPQASTNDSRPKRELALAKMLEGQRHLWRSQRSQTQAGRIDAMRMAKESFEQAVAFDPGMAEGYAALSELAVTMPPPNIDQAVRLATEAVRIDGQNFGGHRMLARLYTIRSRIDSVQVDPAAAEKAVGSWRAITRLDPRNAEAWAFLSLFAEKLGKQEDQIEALRKWVSAAPPVDVQFYGRVVGSDASLSPETASLKLASALAHSGRRDEAAGILSQLIADDGENGEAVSLLEMVVDSVEGESATIVARALHQAVYANPTNVSLILMLAKLQNRFGRFDQAEQTLERHIASIGKVDRPAASRLTLTLAEMYVSGDKFDEAIHTLESAFALRGISGSKISREDREFAIFVFEQLIRVNKIIDRPIQAKAVIDRARKILGPADPFPDRQAVALLQANGKREEALALARTLRIGGASDLTLVRMEASLLTQLGRVDEAVEIIRNRRSGSPTPRASNSDPDVISISVPSSDQFSDLLFIANLYIKAGRTKEAIAAANQAYASANGAERKQIAKMTAATVMQAGGDFAAAEETLRAVLKEMPGNPVALNNLGFFLVERGERLDEATEMIRQALKIDPTNPSYLDSLGWACLKAGKIDDAERYLRDAVKADTDSAAALEHLGDVYEAKKDMQRARSYWSRALRIASGPAAVNRLNRKLGK